LVSLYLDHNVSLHLASPLRAAGHDVVSARDLNRIRLSDDAQLLSAVRLARILVTHNRRDFLLLHEAWIAWPAALGAAFPAHRGILVLDAASDRMLATIVSDFLSAGAYEDLSNSLLWWHGPDGWFRRRTGVGWEPDRSTTM